MAISLNFINISISKIINKTIYCFFFFKFNHRRDITKQQNHKRKTVLNILVIKNGLRNCRLRNINIFVSITVTELLRTTHELNRI